MLNLNNDQIYVMENNTNLKMEVTILYNTIQSSTFWSIVKNDKYYCLYEIDKILEKNDTKNKNIILDIRKHISKINKWNFKKYKNFK